MTAIPASMAWRRTTVAVVIAAASMCAERAYAQGAAGADVRAAFLFNFVKFIDWPATALPEGQPFVIGVYGDESIASSLAAIVKGKSVNGRSLSVKRLAPGDDPGGVQLLFIGAAESARIQVLIKQLRSAGVLTVSDAYRFCISGGMIQFRSEADRVRFDINLRAAEAAGLVINSKLLALAGAVNPRSN